LIQTNGIRRAAPYKMKLLQPLHMVCKVEVVLYGLPSQLV
jgi:hypothetical protein